MAIKTDAQRKARTIEGKPVGEWFDAAAQRQKRDNKYASYDSPMRRPLPEAEKETKAEQKTEPKGAEKTESAYDKGKAMGIAAIEQARNSRFSRRFPARPSEKPGTGSTIASLLAKPSAHAKGKEMGKSAIADARNEGIKASRRRSRGSSFPARPAESKRPSDSYVSKPGNKSTLDMPSGNADVEVAKKKRMADTKAHDSVIDRILQKQTQVRTEHIASSLDKANAVDAAQATEARRKEDAQKKSVAANASKAPYLPNKLRSFSL